MKKTDEFSLLYLYENEKNSCEQLNYEAVDDLSLDNILSLFSDKAKVQSLVMEILTSIVFERETILYRQNIISDILENSNIYESLKKVSYNLEILNGYFEKNNKSKVGFENDFYEKIWRIDELSNFIQVVDTLFSTYEKVKSNINSQGLKNLFEYISAIFSDGKYMKLKSEMPKLLKIKDKISSFTIAINLDSASRPKEAILISINENRDYGNLLGNRIFEETTNIKTPISELSTAPKVGTFLGMHYSMDFFMREIAYFKEEEKNIISEILLEFEDIDTSILGKLQKEIIFYISSVNMINKLKDENLPISKPEILSKEFRHFEVKNNFSLNLVRAKLGENLDLNKIIVKNSFKMGDDERIFVLTGANSGGKTTYMEAFGITQILAQAGVYVPGENAKISIVDNIFTHYQKEEEYDKNTGRLGQESDRIKHIFDRISPYSLLFLNESFSSTSEVDGSYIAEEVLKAISLWGARAIYTTHILSLAENIDKINSEMNNDTKLVNMVAQVKRRDDGTYERTYKIKKSKPMESSYARDIIDEYGISYNKLVIFQSSQ